MVEAGGYFSVRFLRFPGHFCRSRWSSELQLDRSKDTRPLCSVLEMFAVRISATKADSTTAPDAEKPSDAGRRGKDDYAAHRRDDEN